MKKTLAILAAVCILAAAGLFLFLARLDVDRFRPVILQKMEEQLGRPVRLGKISLGWRRGIALELKELAVYPGPQPEGEPAVRVERVSAVLKILPLLRRDVQLSSVALIGPRVHIVRTPSGSIDVEGVTPLPAKAAPPAGPQAPAPAAAQAKPASFLIRFFEIKEGRVRFTDRSAHAPLEVELRDVDLSVTDLSSTRPSEFECRLTAFSGGPNLYARGRIVPPAGGRPPALERFRFETDLARLNVEELLRAFPALQGSGLGQEMEGRIEAVVDRVELDPRGIGEAEAQIRLSAGKVRLAQMKAPLQDLEFEAVAQGGQLSLNALSGRVGGGSFSARGAVKGFSSPQPAGTIQAKAEGLALEDLLAPAGPGEPALKGQLSCSFGGDFQGVSWPEISRSLSGDGWIHLENGVLSNVNLLREVFDRLTLIPGLTDTLLARLPPSYQERIAARDTRFEPIQMEVAVQAGVLSFRELRVATDSFSLTGSGQLDLAGALRLPAVIQVEPDLSEAIFRSVEELRFLADAQGRMEIPVLVQGNLPRVSAVPDLGYVATRLAASKGQELIGELLQKVFEKK